MGRNLKNNYAEAKDLESMTPVEFFQHIKFLLHDRNITIKKMCEDCNLSRERTVSLLNIKTGAENNVGFETMKIMAEYLGFTLKVSMTPKEKP